MESTKLQDTELKQKEKPAILSVDGICKNYGKHTVLDDVSFSVKEGEVLGLIGPNGAGKTTTLRIITGLLAPTKGKVTICGCDIKKQREKALSALSCIIETPSFYENLSALDHINFISSLHKTSKEQKEAIIEEIGLKDRIKEKVKVYSLGMKQRLGIGLCLASQPRLLILDEPTNALDPTGIFEFRSMIARISKENNVAVVISSHNLAEIQKVCDNLVFIKKGVIVSEKEILQRNDIKTYHLHI